MHSTDPKILALFRKAFPGAKPRAVRVETRETVTFCGTLWDGGGKTEYAVLALETGRVSHVRDAPFMERSPLHEKAHKLMPGFAIASLVHSGLQQYCYLLIHQKDADELMPSAPADVTTNEKIVLFASRSLKSSYAGIKEYRFHEAQNATGITREEWDDAKASLVDNKLLNRRGAITPAGRNSVDGVHSFRQLQRATSLTPQ